VRDWNESELKLLMMRGKEEEKRKKERKGRRKGLEVEKGRPALWETRRAGRLDDTGK
jgi:hypothetical protein